MGAQAKSPEPRYGDRSLDQVILNLFCIQNMKLCNENVSNVTKTIMTRQFINDTENTNEFLKNTQEFLIKYCFC